MVTADETPTVATPRYTRWDQVPFGLYTRNQLGQLDPKRRVRKDAEPRAHVLYHGNRYAPLFTIDDANVRPPASPAQLAAAQRAGELRYICRWCQHRNEFKPLRNRICGGCAAVVRTYAMHLEGRAVMGGLHQAAPGEYRPLYAACSSQPEDVWPARIVVFDPTTGEITSDHQIPGPTPDRYEISALGGGRHIMTWDDWPGTRSLRWYYRRWLGQTSPETAEMPGTTGDLAADARALAALAGDVIFGRIQPPEPNWLARGLTPEQMRPYAAIYGTTSDVVEFVTSIEAAA